MRPEDDSYPAACSLDGTESASRRRRWLELAELALLDKAANSRGVRVCFRADAEVARELLDLVELERHCCSFASWVVTADEAAVVLDVSAEGEGVAAVRAMFDEPAGVAAGGSAL